MYEDDGAENGAKNNGQDYDAYGLLEKRSCQAEFAEENQELGPSKYIITIPAFRL